MDALAERSVVRPHGPSDVAAALLDVSQPFDDDLLERLNGWIAGTTGTPYDPPPARTVDAAESTTLSSSIWPSASFRVPSAAAAAPASAAAAAPTAYPVRTAAAASSVSIRWSPPRLGRQTPVSASSTFGLLGGESRRVLPDDNDDDDDESPGAARPPVQARSAYRAEVFDFPTGAVLGDVVLVQARFRGRKAQRFVKKYHALLTRRMARETAATYHAWQFLTHATRTRLKALKRAAFFALRDYSRLTVRLFSSVAIYLEKMLGRTEYSASSMWNLAQRKPVPGLEHLSTMPTYLYTSIYSRLYRQHSERFFKRLKQNLRYWKGKRASAKGMWKASFRHRSRAVLVVWFRFGKLMIAERTLHSIPVFEEHFPEWDVCLENYMKTASTMRKVASLSVENVLRRSFRRLQVYLGRPGSMSQQIYAEEYFVQHGQRQCLQAWAELKDNGRAEQFFFRLVFRRWRSQARDAFYSLRLLERQLFKWVCQRNCRRCFRAMQAYRDYSLMMSYAATQRIRSPNEHAVVLKVVFQWQGQTWHVAMLHCWENWRKFTRMRRAFSTFVTRHSIARRDELLLISFLAFHRHYRAALKAAEKDAREAAAVAGKDPKAVQCKQVAPLDRKYEMDACEDHGAVDTKTVEQAIEQFPDDDFDTAIQHHRKIHFAQWKAVHDKSLFKRVFTFQMQQTRAKVQAETDQGSSAIDSSRPGKDRPTERQRLIDAKVAMKAAEQKYGSREEAEVHFRRELQYATEVRSSAESSHADIIERHAFRFDNTEEEDNATAETKPKKTSKKTKKKDPHSAVQVSTVDVDDSSVVDLRPSVGAEPPKKQSKADVRNNADSETVPFEEQRTAKSGNTQAPAPVREATSPQTAQDSRPAKKSTDSSQVSVPDETPADSKPAQQTENPPLSEPDIEEQHPQDKAPLAPHEDAHVPPQLQSNSTPATTSSKRMSKKKAKAKQTKKASGKKQRSADQKAAPTNKDTVAMLDTKLGNPISQDTAIENSATVDIQNDAAAIDAVQSMAGKQCVPQEQLELKEATVPTTDSVSEHPVQKSPEHTPRFVETSLQERKLSALDTDVAASAVVVNVEESSPTPVLTQDLVFREPDTFDDADVVAHTDELEDSSEKLKAPDLEHDASAINAGELSDPHASVTGPIDDLPDGFANTTRPKVRGPSAVVDIEVPEGVEPGKPIIVTTSDEQKVEVIVPEGVRPGDVFQATVAGTEHHTDPSPEVVQFTVPSGAEPGHVVAITSRQTGRHMEMIVPEGMAPGDTFPVSLARVHEKVGAEVTNTTRPKVRGPSAVVDIEVPEGVEPGKPIIVTTSDEQKVEVIVPEGVRPGDVFQATVAGTEHHTDPSPEVVQFTVPSGAEPGHVVAITSRQTGRHMEMIVPEGMAPGDTFPVSLARVHEKVGAEVSAPDRAESGGAKVKQSATPDDINCSSDQTEDEFVESISDAWGPSDGPAQEQDSSGLELESEPEPEPEPELESELEQSVEADRQAGAFDEHAPEVSSQQQVESVEQEILSNSTREELLGISGQIPKVAPNEASIALGDEAADDIRSAKQRPDNQRDVDLHLAVSTDTTPAADGEDAAPDGSSGLFVAEVTKKPAEKTDSPPPAQSHPVEDQSTAVRREIAGNEDPALPQTDQKYREDEQGSVPEVNEADKILSQENSNSRMASVDTQATDLMQSSTTIDRGSEDTAASSTGSASDPLTTRSSADTDNPPQHHDAQGKAESHPASRPMAVDSASQEESPGSPGAAASRALQREDTALAHSATTAADAFSGASVLDMSSEELDAVRRSELELLERLKQIAHSNRELSDMDEDMIKNALEKDLLKFKGPDIYERNTYRAKINEQALKSRVRKDQLYWLYQQAELALERHASEVSHIPLEQFKIPVTGPFGFSRDQPNIDVGSRDQRPASTYDNIASYFAQVKEHLAARGQQGAETGWADRPSTVATPQGVTEEMSRLSSRFPSLAQRAPASRPRRPNTVGDGRRSKDANSREGRTTHAAEISHAAVSAWAGGSSIAPSESYLYSADGSAAIDSRYAGARPGCGHPLHSSISCPGCGSAEHIAEVEMHRQSTSALTAVNLNRLREKAQDPSKYHLERTIDGEEAPSHLTKAEQEEEFRRAHFGGGGAAGRSQKQRGKPRAGLTPGVLRPNLAGAVGMLPPLETDMQLTVMSQSQSAIEVGSDLTDESTMHLDSATQSQFSLTGDDGFQPTVRRRKRRKKKAWKSPYRPTDEEDADALRPRRTAPSFGGGDDIGDFEMSGAGLRVPPHLLDLIGHVEEMLDSGDVEAALEHITSSFVGA